MCQYLYFQKSLKPPYITKGNLAEEQKIHYLCHQFETALYEQQQQEKNHRLDIP